MDHLFEEMERSGITLILARVHAEALAGLARSGLGARLRAVAIQPNVSDAVRIAVAGDPRGDAAMHGGP